MRENPGSQPFQRLAMLVGEGALERLWRTQVLVFGVGGVGGWCAEALARSGVGRICIADFDAVCESNINRQLQATSRTLGRAKVDVLKERLLEISPGCEVVAWERRFSRESAGEFGIGAADFVVDAIDNLADKLDLIEAACASGARLFSSMGMARKMDPTRVKTASVWETRGCPLARLVRQGLRKRGFRGDFTVVYGEECLDNVPINFYSDAGAPPDVDSAVGQARRGKPPNGSVVTVTATAGMILASLVLCGVCGEPGGER